MAISGNDVQVWTWRVVKFSMRCAYTLIKNHPFVSCPVLFFLVLYICFPSFFWISLYSSVFLILAVSVTKIYLSHRNAKSFRRDGKNSDAESIRKDAFAKNDATKNRNEKSFVRARSVRRRKPRETSRDSSVHTSEDEKNTFFSSTFNGDMVDKTALTEERPKEIREIEVDSVISHAECSSSNESSGLGPELHDKSYEGSRKFGGGGGDMEIESSEGTDEEDEQEREANNKAVQWTETDQRNLMDLGFSEIERNKRLESLIARRRARKMLSLQVRRSVVKMNSLENPGPMTSLTIPRNNNSFLASQSTGNFSPMPGSAPSVLLPNYNPFDLPYDAQEEKPILTGGSFQLEFKDMTFIRNESVGLGASVPGELNEDQQETSLSHDSTKNEGVSEGLQNSQVKDQLDEKGTAKIIEVESCQSPKSKLKTITANIVIKEEVPDSRKEMDLVSNCQEENSSEVQIKSVLVEDSIDNLSSASSSEDDVPIYRVDKDAVLRSLASPLLRNMSMNRDGSSQMGYVNNYDPSVIDKNKLQEHFCHADKAMQHNNHTPMSSIASDLQVEVSEVSSPGLKDDGSILFPDEEFSAYKEDVENESTTGNEDISEISSQLPRVDENESKEVYNVNEDNTVEVRFSRTKESENLLSHELAETVIEHDTTDSLSWSASKAELPDRSEHHSSSFHSNIKDNFQLSTSSDLSHALASDNLVFPITDKVQQLEGDPVANISQNDDSEKQEQPSYPTLKSMGELGTIYNANDSKVLQNNDEEFNIRERDDIVDLLIKQGRKEPTKLLETSSSNSVDYTGNQPEKKEYHSILELVGKNVDAKISEDIEGESKDAKQDKMDDFMAIEDNDTLESIQVDGEQRRAEPRSSGVHPRLSDHRLRALLPELVLEQSHIASSASSPRSVLQPNISLDPSSLSSFSDDAHVEIQQFHPQRVENGMLDEATCTLSQSTMLMVDSISHPLHEESSKALEKSSNHSTSTEEANFTGSVREDMVHVNESKQNETNNIPEGSSERQESTNLSKSTEAANSSGSVSQDRVQEDERRQNKTHCILGSSGRQESFNLSSSTKKDNYTGSLSEDTVNENERRQNKTNCTPEGSSGRQESFNPSTSAWEDNKTESLSEDIFCENERGQNKTNYIPEGSTERWETSNLVTCTEQGNSMGAVSQKLIHENEIIRPSEMKVIPEGSSRKLSGPDSAAALSKLPKEINPDLPAVEQESSNLLTSTKDANYIGPVSKHAILEEEKKHNETKDIPEVSSNNLSNYDSKAALSKPVEETNSYLPLLAPIEETNSMETVSEQVIPESEQRQKETKDISEGRLEKLSPEPTVALSKGIGEFSFDIPHTVLESSNLSASPEEAKSMEFANGHIIHEHEKEQNEAEDTPVRSSLGLSSPDETAALWEKTERVSSRSLTMTDDRSDELHKHEAENEALPALLNPMEQVNKLNALIINREEIYQFQGNPFGVTYKAEVLNSVDSKPQASINSTTSKDTHSIVNELQKVGEHKDHTGPSTLVETSNVSKDKYVSTSADEKKGGFSKPFEGESKISSPKEITGIEPSKSAEENNIQNSHIFSPETEITANAPVGRSIEEVNGNPNTEKAVVSQMDGQSKDEIVKEVPRV